MEETAPSVAATAELSELLVLSQPSCGAQSSRLTVVTGKQDREGGPPPGRGPDTIQMVEPSLMVPSVDSLTFSAPERRAMLRKRGEGGKRE